MVDGTLDMIIKGGQVVTAAGIKDLAIGIKDGKVAVLAADEALSLAGEVIDARGKHIFPGLVDPENHLGTQRPLKDSLNSETRAAAAGSRQ